MGAKPVITESLGYLNGIKRNNQVKIATSNLFIETSSINIDDAVSATFDGIGGLEFINSGYSDIILKADSSIISNSSEILGAISSKQNEKQADGTEAILNKYNINLNNYVPVNISKPVYIGTTTYSYYEDIYSSVNSPNVYFDTINKNIFVSETATVSGATILGSTRTATITLPTGTIASKLLQAGDILTATDGTGSLGSSEIKVTSVSNSTNTFQISSYTIKGGYAVSNGTITNLFKSSTSFTHIFIELQDIQDDEEVEIEFISYNSVFSDTI
jgi:hypothetical protein